MTETFCFLLSDKSNICKVGNVFNAVIYFFFGWVVFEFVFKLIRVIKVIFYDPLASVRDDKIDLLKNADMPLAELSVENAELIYKGRKWDSMSGSDQLKVATAIVRKLNPECGFVLLDKLEQMDIETLADFGMWLEKEQLQAIATRVSTGSECSIIIEDGKIKPSESIYGGF